MNQLAGGQQLNLPHVIPRSFLKLNKFIRILCDKMSLSKELLRVCEANRIRREHLDFVVDVEIAESILEPAELPRRIFKDRMNPLKSMRPLELRITFGMSKGGILSAKIFGVPLLSGHT